MVFEELKKKASELPLLPGVYIMKDRDDAVIYVGKAKKLRNRVSQYFVDTISHSPKTRLMISKITKFDVIVAASEFEALVLECSLIKQYLPRYNILLKDDKGYPFLRLDMKEEYPAIKMVSKTEDDGAEYFGPFGSRGVTLQILETVNAVYKLYNCSKKFPRDIGKGRPCLNYHMDRCQGWCRTGELRGEYCARIEQARQLLLGNYKKVAAEIRSHMLSAAEDLRFEVASELKKRLDAVELLRRKQLVTSVSAVDTDVVGFAQSGSKFCFAVLHYCNGDLVDKDFQLYPLMDDPAVAGAALVKQYYLSRGFAPKRILLPSPMEDQQLYEELLTKRFNKRIYITAPQRGDRAKMVALAVQNAREEAVLAADKEEHTNATLTLLQKLLGMESLNRIESYDISNLSGADIVGAMVVYIDGKPKKSEYKRFKIQGLTMQDDYASMEQVLRRRFMHYLQGDDGFTDKPDVLLIDGGVAHATVAERVLQELNIAIPIFGMVKDDRHRTRALVTPRGEQIQIDSQQSVFSFVGSIQEETHRFAIAYNRKLRTNRVRYSELDTITGIGPKRKQVLLRAFHSLRGIKEASLEELQRYLPQDAANAVYQKFNK